MSGNRFDFLEFGDGGAAHPTQPADDVPVGADPIAPRLPDGSALAEVRLDDTGRGLYSQMRHAAEAEAIDRARAGTTLPSGGGLRAVEVFGGRGERAGEFNFPGGLALDLWGNLYIADAYNHRLQRVTPDNGVAIIGERGYGRGQFLSPQAVTTDPEGSFYAIEQGCHRVQKFRSDGVQELVFGRQGGKPGEFQGPVGIAVAPGSGDIYVADAGNYRVQRFDRRGTFLMQIGASGHPRVVFGSPQGVATDGADNLYVADTFGHRVLRFDPLGRPAGVYAGTLFEPRAVACDAGLLYVADGGPGSATGTGGRIQVLDARTGQALTSLDQPGRRLGAWGRPAGIAVAPGRREHQMTVARGDLYVSDTMNHRVLRFVWE